MSIDNYGEFELPEEKTEIEVVPNPVKEILACYELFRKIADEKMCGIHYLSQLHPSRLMQMYDECKKLFEGKQKLKPNEKEIKEIIKEIHKNAKAYDESGMFLSGMQNETSIDKLIIEPFPKDEKYKEPIPIEHLGYCLKKNKLLIITRNARIYNAGQHSEGNIINNGQVYREMGEDAKSGIKINQDYARSMLYKNKGAIGINNATSEFFGGATTRGININNKTTDHLAPSTTGGIHINQGRAKKMAYNGYGGIHISNALLDYFGECATNGIRIKNRGVVKWTNDPKLSLGRYIILDDKTAKRKQLQQKLDLKLKEIEFTKDLGKHSYEKQIKQVEAYDWKKFEKEVTELAERIKREYEK